MSFVIIKAIFSVYLAQTLGNVEPRSATLALRHGKLRNSLASQNTTAQVGKLTTRPSPASAFIASQEPTALNYTYACSRYYKLIDFSQHSQYYSENNKVRSFYAAVKKANYIQNINKILYFNPKTLLRVQLVPLVS